MRHILVLVMLLGLMFLVGQAEVVEGPTLPFDTRTLVSTGFILLAASAMGAIFRDFRLPALLGYLAAGIVFGPSLASLVFGSVDPAPLSPTVIGDLGLVNVLAVGVIGTMGGGEIQLPELRESFKKVAAITAVTFALVLPTVAGVVLGMAWLLPDLIPFLADVPTPGRVAAALLIAALSVGMSPSATLALLQEVRAHGRFTSLVLAIVVLADLVLVATFLLVLALAKLLVSPEGFSADALLGALPSIAAEFGWAILLGILVGIVFIVYLRLVQRELLLFSLAVIFVTTFVASRLHAETLLAFLVAGFVVQNFSSHGHTLIHAFERIALPVFVIYFTTQAAALDLVSVSVYLPLTLTLVAVRCSLFYFGIGVGARLARVDDVTRGHLQVSFFSQGGVDLVLAAMVAQAIPGWGGAVQTVTMATILFYVVGGPAFLARALDAMGESAAARERGAEELAERKDRASTDATTAELAAPRIAEGALGRRLGELHRLVTDLVASEIRGGAMQRCRERGELIAGLAHSITRATAREIELTPDETVQEADVQAIVHELDRAVTGAARRWSRPDLLPVAPTFVREIGKRLTGAELFSSAHRIPRDPSLFEPRGGLVPRLIRFGRRVRRAIFGPGMRTVPTGRLWRYHVALDVPAALWSSLRPREAELWQALAEHYRLTRRDVASLLDATPTPTSPDPAASQSTRAAKVEPSGPSSLAERLERVRAQAEERERALLERIEAADRSLEQALTRSLVGAWNAFLEAIELAGTLEYPSWRYRVSRRYDTAQAATAELHERLERDRELSRGLHDDADALAHAQATAAWTSDAVRRHAASMQKKLGPARDSLARAIVACAAWGRGEVEPPTEDAGEGPSSTDVQTARPADALQAAVDAAIAALEQAGRRIQVQAQLGRRAQAQRRALSDVPEIVAPLQDPEGTMTSEREVRRTEVRLRAWLDQSMMRELAVAVATADEQIESALGRIRVGLHHARQVVDYHAHAADASLQVDEGLGERVSALIERARSDLETAVTSSLREVAERTRRAIDDGLGPISARQWTEIGRQLRRAEEPRPAAVATRWIRERQRRIARWGMRRFTRVRDEVAALFAERSTLEEEAAYRRLLLGDRSRMPEVYQRLFTSVPAESVGLIVDRPEAAQLRAAVQRWTKGRRGGILLRGDRGSGKRTLVRQILSDELAELEIGWIRLSPALQAERDVAPRLAEAAGWRQRTSFADLAARVRGEGALEPLRRRAVVIENAERLFRRTPEGLARMRSFFELVTASDDRILWIVVLAEPAARLLDPALELRARIPDIIEVGPLGPRQIQEILTVRHRLSGYALRIRTSTPTLVDWSRGPVSAWRALRGIPEATYDRIATLAGGNVRQALRLWLAAIDVDPADPSRAVIGSLPAVPSPLLETLPLHSRMLLALLVLHGPLTKADLLSCPGIQDTFLDAELGRLAHLGLVELEPWRVGIAAAEDVLVAIPTRVAQPITQELRQHNLI